MPFSLFFFNATATSEIYTLSLHDALPISLYAGECLAEEFCLQRVGVKVQVVELADVDEALFAEVARPPHGSDRDRRRRSEEHTSELQSRFDLVCRLLLEKKKKYI